MIKLIIGIIFGILTLAEIWALSYWIHITEAHDVPWMLIPGLVTCATTLFCAITFFDKSIKS